MVREPLTPRQREDGRRLGRALRSARGERSLLEVALQAGISPETLRKIEAGRIATPSFVVVASVARVLSVALDDLAGETVSDRTVPTAG